ncbi:MAG: hypothetical protein AAF368_00730 [Planctomycetota bacterium]
MNGIPHKDLDIFVPARDAHEASRIEDRIVDHLRESPSSGLAECDMKAYREHFSGAFLGLTEFALRGEIVQIVYLDLYNGDTAAGGDIFMHSVLERIDFGACQIAFDGCGVVHTKAFNWDYLGRTFTLVRALNGASVMASLRRFERLSEKYPDHTFEIAQAIYDDGTPINVS